MTSRRTPLQRILVLATLAALMAGLLPNVSADDQIRKWTDKTGKFEVEAKLLKFADGNVVLLKKDGRAITVPLAALSEADQKFIKESMPAAAPNPFAGGVPVPVPGAAIPPGPAPVPDGSLLVDGAKARELTSAGQSIPLDESAAMPPLIADPAVAVPKFQQFTCHVEKQDAYAGKSSPILIEATTPVFAVSTHRVANASSPANYGRIHLVRPHARASTVALELKDTLLLFDHHVPSGRSLAVIGVNSPSDRGGDIVLLDKLATGKPVALARWHLPEWQKPGFKPKVEFARLIDGDRAVVQVNSAVYIWRLTTGQLVMKIDRIRAGAKIEVSPGGKFLAIPTSKACHVIDLAEGQQMGAISFPSLLTPEVKFSPNGDQVALVAGNQFLVWDVSNGIVTAEGKVAKPCGMFFGWIGDRYLATQLAGLIDPQLGMSLWYYNVPSNKQALPMPGGMAMLDREVQLMCLPMPHPPVQGVAQKLAAGDDQLLLIRPGTEVSLKVDAIEGVDQQAMLAALQTAVEKAGWKVSQNSPIQLVATIQRGDKQKLHFRKIGTPLRGPHETVTIRPYTASLVVRQGASELWTRSSTNMVPSFLRLEQGETLKQAVRKYEKADPEYFSRLSLPPKILRPEIAKSVGTSRIDAGNWRDY